MTTINGNASSNINLFNAPPPPSTRSVGTDKPDSIRNYSVMGQGIAAMEEVMVLFTELANAKFDQMKKKTDVSRDAQDKANSVEALLARLIKDDETIALTDDVIQYMRDNNITVGGKTIDEFISETGSEMDKGDLMAVKAALESTSGRASDFVQQTQLKLQQFMQNFNTAVSMVNSMQSMNAESTKSIAQAIR